MEKENKNIKSVVLPALNIKKIIIPIKGKTPLIMMRMSEETKEDILIKQTGISKGSKKKVRDIEKETQNSVHITTTGKIGFPEYGFKKGMMYASARVGDKSFSRTLISGSVQIINSEEGLIPINFKKQGVLEHSVKGQTMFSPIFYDWECELELLYDANNISAQDLAVLIDYAGFYVGIGGWRPLGRDGGSGTHGMYEVKK